jgi:hypothetical protein
VIIPATIFFADLRGYTNLFQETASDKSSRPGESHPQALTDPDVNVSAHPAPTVQPPPDATVANAQRAPDPAAQWHGFDAPSADDAASGA